MFSYSFMSTTRRDCLSGLFLEKFSTTVLYFGKEASCSANRKENALLQNFGKEVFSLRIQKLRPVLGKGNILCCGFKRRSLLSQMQRDLPRSDVTVSKVFCLRCSTIFHDLTSLPTSHRRICAVHAPCTLLTMRLRNAVWTCLV